MTGQNASVLIWDDDGRVLQDGTPFHGFFFEAEILSGTPTPGDPAEIQSVGWYDIHDLPQPQTISGGQLLAGLADGSINAGTRRS